MSKIIITICSVFALMPVSSAFAQNLPKLSISNTYASVFVDRQSLGFNDNTVELEPFVGSIAVGMWVYEGIGLEFEAGSGFAGDSINGLDVKYNSTLGVSLRLESPPTSDFAVYVLAGYVRSGYDARSNSVTSKVLLPGGRLAAGMTYAFTPNLLLDASFTHHDYDEDVRVNSVRLGVRFELDSRP